MQIQNPLIHHPFLSGIKLVFLFILFPLFMNSLSMGDAEFWGWYGWVIAFFYPFEIICVVLFVLGGRRWIDSTVYYYEDYSEDYFFYSTYEPPAPLAPYLVVDQSDPYHHPFYIPPNHFQ